MKQQNRELDNCPGVTRRVKVVSLPTVLCSLTTLDEATVFRRLVRDRLANAREILVLDEDDDGCQGISTGQVAEKLIDGFKILLGTFPDFAFRNEDIIDPERNQNVGLPAFVECFGRRRREVCGQGREEKIAQCFLILIREDAPVPLHFDTDAVDDARIRSAMACSESELVPARAPRE